VKDIIQNLFLQVICIREMNYKQLHVVYQILIKTFIVIRDGLYVLEYQILFSFWLTKFKSSIIYRDVQNNIRGYGSIIKVVTDNY